MALDANTALTKAQHLYTRLASRRPEISKLENYADGKQPLAFASNEWAKIHERRYSGFSDNWCGVVGSAPAERTRIEGFRLGGDADPMSENEKVLWRDWELNDGPAQSSQGFQTATVSKRSFAMVWGDRDDNPTLTWEHPSQVIVDYAQENPRLRTAALKSWQDDDREYMTLYTPDEVWKWARPAWSHRNSDGRTDSGIYVPSSGFGAGGWVPRMGEGDDTWPIKNPLGAVPVVEYPNRPRLGSGPQSDIAGTTAMQDATNLLWAYLFVAADYASMPGRVVTGAQPPKMPVLDGDGNKIGERPIDIEALTKGRMLWLTGENAKISQWDAAKLDVFTGVINIAIRHIAAQTRTPIYLIHGELGNVNGETLTGLDAPLVSKVRDAQAFYTASVRDTFSLMASVRGNAGLAQECRLGFVKWKNPALASEVQISDAAIKSRQAGMPFQAVLEDTYGKSPSEVSRIMEMLKSEQSDPTMENIARSLGGQ